MELTNTFEVDRPIDETWKILMDLEFIAPCMPGAQLTEIEGEEYRGLVKIKVGPITAQYKGKARFVEQDEVARRAQLKAEGRDPRQGNANAMVTATMEPSSETTTSVTVHTDLSLSGKIASFGRGAIEDVSKKILGQFTDNLRDKLAQDQDKAAPPEETATAAKAEATAASTVSNAATAAAATNVRKIDSAEPEPVDLLAVTGSTLTKRLAPVVGGVFVLLILRWLLRGRD